MNNLFDLHLSLNGAFDILEVEVTNAEYNVSKQNVSAGKNLFFHFSSNNSITDIKRKIEKSGKWSGYLERNQTKLSGGICVIKKSETGDSNYSAYFLADENTPGKLAGIEAGNIFSSTGNRSFFAWKQCEHEDKNEVILYTGGVLVVTGYNTHEINNMPGKLYNLLHPSDVSNVLKSQMEFKLDKSKTSGTFIFRLLNRAGNTVWVEETVNIKRNEEGDIVTISGVVTDITEFKEKELGLLESESNFKTENDAKDRFINILSHDLRAPFTSIMGFAEILLSDGDLAEKEKNEYLQYILDASKGQIQFVNYLLDWSRLRTGKLRVETQRLPLQGIVYSAVSALTGNAVRKNIEISVEIPEEIFVQADDNLLSQVIINLLSNAIKFSHPNGKIEILASIFNNNQAELIVRDYGTGIGAEDKDKIFNLENSISKTGTTGEKGIGFGLNLVKEIVQKHKGEIWFYSEPGSGTEFHITIPLPSNVIIVVSSDHTQNSSLKNILEESFPDYETIVFTNGYQALETIGEKTPNLIISDKYLPLMSGIQFLESVNMNNSNYKTPVILIYGEEEEHDHQKLIELGVKAMIKKPLNLRDVIKHLEKVLN
ncbi:MAG: response regulator [Ignavibacteriaceae bacterium]|nr:response regulator [Ignavibacteriaceae bacterium]